MLIFAQNLQTFPKGIEKFFPNLIAISVDDNKIKTISKDDLNFPRLEALNFNRNYLTILDDDLFSATLNLRAVSFGKKKIKNIGINTFKSLHNLNKLDFMGKANCVDVEAGTRNEVKSLISEMAAACAPNNEMLMKEIRSLHDQSDKKLETLKTHVETQLKEMENNIRIAFDGKLDSLKRQIDYLVKKIEDMN